MDFEIPMSTDLYRWNIDGLNIKQIILKVLYKIKLKII